jgi:hypothetical protein
MGMINCTLGCYCTVVVLHNGNRMDVDRTVMQCFCRCNVVHKDTTAAFTLPLIKNVHKLVEVQMANPNMRPPYKFTDLCHEIIGITIPSKDPVRDCHQAFVFDAIILIQSGYAARGATVTIRADCVNANKLLTKMKQGIVPWMFHYWSVVQGYKETCIKSLMESFDTDAALLARFFSFDPDTLEVNTQFGDVDEYFKGMKADLGINQGWSANNDDKNIRFSLEGAWEALHQPLHD